MPTERTFKAVAEIIKKHYHAANRHADLPFENLADDLADFFARENPNFDRNKFMEACGMKETP